ncbi:Rne/Rng family ribonuclease [Bifidobacterium gallicum]|uniref:Ribonuclease E n=1 Tax=Bifidobacterium gallicum DSM 20093 = LMG 11596 TaxID=561180 RepID=D1NUK6_9BIFI|nr:S1 RNA binding domain protein [Bifidobacterium gallicum DSM 20093 = LMG 11596]
MVRGAGAAGAQLQLKVEDHALLDPPSPAPAFEQTADQPAPPAPPATADRSDEQESQPRRRTRRRSAAREHEQTFREPPTAPRRAASQSDDAVPDLALDVLDSLPAMPRAARGMTSLLFQEPVLPAQHSRSHEDRSESASEHHDDFREPTRSSSRHRRLNAQERRAAAEVEQIEEDLELDDITYSPIDDDTVDQPRPSRRRRRGQSSRADRETQDNGESAAHEHARDERGRADREREEEEEARSTTRRRRRRSSAAAQSDEDQVQSATAEDDEEQPTTRRRRRRNRQQDADDAANEQTKDTAADDETDNADRARSSDDEDEGATVTRRRRRRRSSSKNAEDEQTTTRRSRKQQYMDEITDVEGSTRLEAKKQRRRDNRRERNRQNQLLEQDFLARRENVDRLMVVRQRGRHTQISVIEDNILVEHYVSDIQEVATVGNIYLGRVQNVLPSMEAAFVDIGQARNGVLYAGEVNWDTTRLEGQPRRIEHAFRSGDPVLVQVTKDPIGHKGARLTSQVTLAGRFLVLVPSGGMTGVSRKLSEHERSRLKSIVAKVAPKDMGVIIRTAAEGASEEAITKDLENLMHQWEHITAKREEFRNGKRPKLLQGEPDVAIRVVRDIFNDDFSKLIVEGETVYERIAEYLDTMAPDLKAKLEQWDPAEHQGKDVFDKWQIDSQLRKGMERQVYLPSGGSIVIDRTEAMTTIDVNTGRFIGKGRSLEETVTACNLEAAEEIARQLRLRDIGGMVMIDFVDMVMPANRDLVLRRLLECLARDRTKHQVAEVTSLGLVQMTRKRIGQGLVEAFSEECPTCKGRGFIVHDEPTVSADFEDPYALKGGDPFIKTNKHGQGTAVHAPKGSSESVKAKLAQIAAAAVAANSDAEEAEDAMDEAEQAEVTIESIEEN